MKSRHKLVEDLRKWLMQLMKSLHSKVLKLEEKLEQSNFSKRNLEVKFRRLEDKQKSMNEQNHLWCKKIHNLQQNGRRECFPLDKFEIGDALSTIAFSKTVKHYIKNEKQIESNHDDYNRTHRIRLEKEKIVKSTNKTMVKFRNLFLRTQVYRARNHKAKIILKLD